MRFLAPLLALALLVAPAAALAYNGHADPAQETHHYSELSDGCDLGFSHVPADGEKPAALTIFVMGTGCGSADRDIADACGRALPGFAADDTDPYWADMLKCPAGNDQDANGMDPFYTDLYRAYGLFIQGQ